MKLAVVGGGSTYTPELIDGLASRATDLSLDRIALFDIDAERLRIVGGFIRRLLAKRAPQVMVSTHAQLVPAIENADFVLVQMRVGGQEARKSDELCGARHGLIGQETTGVGGFRKAMRTIPAMLQICAAIEEHCPHAVLINFTNPVSIVTQAILHHSRVHAIGLCNIPIGFRMDLAGFLGVAPEHVKIDSVGLNHLSFVRAVRVDGLDVLPKLVVEATGDRANRPANIPELDYPPTFLRSLGMIPSDYLKYFLMEQDMLSEQAERGKTRAEEVMEIEAELVAYYADVANNTKPESLSKRGGAYYSHAAIEVIEAIAGNRGDELVVDVLNGNAVRELPPDAVVELPCVVDKRGARPIAQPPMPPEIRGIVQHVKAYEELTVRAAVDKDRRTALLALVTNPLVRSATLATQIVDEIAEELGLR